MRRVYIGKFSHHIRERDIERFFSREGRIREVLMKDGFAFVEFDHTNDAEAAVKRLDGRDLSGERVHVEFAKGPPRNQRDGMRGAGSMGMNRSQGRDRPPRREFRNDRGGRDRGDRGDRGDRDRPDNRSSGGGGGISYAEKYGPPRNTNFRVIVENLSSRVSWQDLKDLMRQAGEVTFADAHKKERNMGIVDFATAKDMKHAIETLNDTEFHGRRIKVYEDKGRKNEGARGGRDDRRDFGGRRGGRSRSRTRSRSRSQRRYSNSRSRSRDRAPASRSRSRSPIVRNRDVPSRSRSASSSPLARRELHRSRSRSRSRSGSRNRDSSKVEKRQSRSRSASRSRSKSQSASPAERRSRSRSLSSSRSNGKNVKHDKSTNNNNNDAVNKLTGGDYSPRESASRSRSKETSRSPSPSPKKARLSVTPRRSPTSGKAED